MLTVYFCSKVKTLKMKFLIIVLLNAQKMSRIIIQKSKHCGHFPSKFWISFYFLFYKQNVYCLFPQEPIFWNNSIHILKNNFPSGDRFQFFSRPQQRSTVFKILLEERLRMIIVKFLCYIIGERR
jgi:hypothetical protein